MPSPNKIPPTQLNRPSGTPDCPAVIARAQSAEVSRQQKAGAMRLEAGMAIYDALYRGARDGFDEGHDWQASWQARTTPTPHKGRIA